MNPDFTLELIKSNQKLGRVADALRAQSVFAVDIETTEWWNRQREQIALIQIAYREDQKPKVAIIDALAGLTLNILRKPLEEKAILKIMHNAAFDAPRLAKAYEINASPVYDTMLAARKSGERKYSLKAQAAIHLGLNLDKSAQRSDWSRRPLDMRQLSYAALDAHATLLLYEHQVRRNLKYDYRLKKAVSSEQFSLPLGETREKEIMVPAPSAPADEVSFATELKDLSAALLGIVAELPTRYSPDSLAVSLVSARTGLAGWIIDQRLGKDAELDEETVKIAIADLSERKLLHITDMRRLEATETGRLLWQDMKHR